MRGGEQKREKETQADSVLCAEPDTQLDLTTEITSWAEAKSHSLHRPRHPLCYFLRRDLTTMFWSLLRHWRKSTPAGGRQTGKSIRHLLPFVWTTCTEVIHPDRIPAATVAPATGAVVLWGTATKAPGLSGFGKLKCPTQFWWVYYRMLPVMSATHKCIETMTPPQAPFQRVPLIDSRSYFPVLKFKAVTLPCGSKTDQSLFNRLCKMMKQAWEEDTSPTCFVGLGDLRDWVLGHLSL